MLYLDNVRRKKNNTFPPHTPLNPPPKDQKANLIIGIREKKQSKKTGLHIPSQTK